MVCTRPNGAGDPLDESALTSDFRRNFRCGRVLIRTTEVCAGDGGMARLDASREQVVAAVDEHARVLRGRGRVVEPDRAGPGHQPTVGMAAVLGRGLIMAGILRTSTQQLAGSLADPHARGTACRTFRRRGFHSASVTPAAPICRPAHAPERSAESGRVRRGCRCTGRSPACHRDQHRDPNRPEYE